jgi:UDP-glucose:(glucosyl)LPS alpha-1,3-glucosyltransferase
VSEDNRRKLAELGERYGTKTEIHIVDPAAFHEFRHFIQFSYYSLSIFSRLVIPAILQGVTDKVLYLDADILCVGKVDELVNMDLGDEIAAVVPDAEITTRRRCAALGLKHGKYFNGGVLYINIEKWLENHITEEAMQALLQLGKKLRFNDQDALNIVLDGRARFIEKRWNYIYDLIYDLDRNTTAMRPIEDAVFIHFAGAVKPWADWSMHDSRALFRKYHAMSPWADLPLDQAPRNSRELRMQSRFLMKQGRTLEGIRWYVKYLRARSRKRK